MKNNFLRLGPITKKAMNLPGAKLIRSTEGVRISFVVPETGKVSRGCFYSSGEAAARRALSRWERLQKKKKK
ncbi:MAG: hypothetical protein PHT16_02850 [Candidatus Pacebacteria bacterium]|nr:hypothetical protein [Candidatus Paceibacterota bacterium]